MHLIREVKHGAQSTKQEIAIGLSKARRAGVKLPPPKEGTVSEKTRESAKRAVAAGAHGPKPASPRRSRAITAALKREGHTAASKSPPPPQANPAAPKPTARPPSPP